MTLPLIAPDLPTAACTNCGAMLHGAYCQDCGQRRFVERDRRLAHLMGEAWHEITSVDGKLWRTLRGLLLHPGRLSREYLDGRRARYYSPIGLFLIANVLYFFAPGLSDFNLPFVDQVPGRYAVQMLDPTAPDHPERAAWLSRSAGQAHSRWTAGLVQRRLEQRRAVEPSYTLRDLARAYDREAGNIGKVLMLVHVPILALALALVNFRRRMYFAEHFVVALHLFTFLLFFVQLVLLPGHWVISQLSLEFPRWLDVPARMGVLGMVVGYLLWACRTAYRSRWPVAALNLVAIVLGLWFANLWVYRALQFLLTLALT